MATTIQNIKPPKVLSQAELQKKVMDIAAKKRAANIGKSNVIAPEVTVGNLADTSSFKTLGSTGQVTQAKAPTVSEVFKNVAKAPVVQQPMQQPQTDVKGQIADLTKQNLINQLQTTYQNTQNRLAQEKAQLTPRFRDIQSNIGTQDVMARERTRKGLAPLGLSKSGAVAQSDVAQNVITQGARSQATALEQELRADIERRISEAQALRNQGIADATTEAEILKLQDRLNQMDTMKAKQEADFLSTIGRFSQDYQAEINRLTNDGDPSNDWQIPFLQAARQDKIATQGLDPTTGQPLDTGVQFTVSQALEATRQGLWNEAIANALGLPFTAQGRVQAISGGGTVQTQPTTQPTRPDAGLSDELLGYQDLQTVLAQGTPSFDRASNRQVYTPTDALGKIRQIQQNYSTYVERFTQPAVDRMVQDLAVEAQLPGYETPVAEEVAPEPTDISQYDDVVKRLYIDDGELLEDQFISYLERISVADPEGAKALALKYGYEAE